MFQSEKAVDYKLYKEDINERSREIIKNSNRIKGAKKSV